MAGDAVGRVTEAQLRRQALVVRVLSKVVLWAGSIAVVAGFVANTDETSRWFDTEPSAWDDPKLFWFGVLAAAVCWLLWAVARGVALHLELAADRMRTRPSAAASTVLD